MSTTSPAAPAATPNVTLFDKAKAKWNGLDWSGKAVTVLCVAVAVLLIGFILWPTGKTTTITTTTSAPAAQLAADAPATTNTASGNVDPVKQGQAIADGVEKKFATRYKAIDDSLTAMQTSQIKTDGRLQKLETPVSDDYYTTLRDTIAGVKK